MCVCRSDLILAVMELVVYLIAVLVFGYYTRSFKQQSAVYVVIVGSLTAFVLHLVSVAMIYKRGAENNIKHWNCIVGSLNIEVFRSLPQCLFFIIFIWLMFKIVIIWRTLKIESDTRAELEKIQIFTI